MKTFEPDRYLSANYYPGRGVLIGRSRDNQYAVVAYFIMGRSVNSRNRVFTETPDGIRTEAYDPSKMEDPSLIIYHPVRIIDGKTIVTNGDQTETIRDSLKNGHCFRHALMTRTFEPDAPNFTPRISGILNPEGDYKLSILKSFGGDPACCCRSFFEYDKPVAGFGHLIHTYEGDGNPLPSFEGEPRVMSIQADCASDFAGLLWNSLNEENRVSLFVQFIRLDSGNRETVIINKHTD